MAGVRVALEIGSKRVFASALDWPGWSRSGKTEQAALEALGAYAARYARVPLRARVQFPAKLASGFEVIERLPGDATTDFGAPGAPAALEAKPMTKAETERLTALVRACWAEFDRVVKAAPAELRKGPRGGGRDRDKMVAHVLEAEAGYSRHLALKLPAPAVDDPRGIAANRKAIIEGIASGAHGKPMRERGWPARYLARRIAWHVMDHAWEIQDRSE